MMTRMGVKRCSRLGQVVAVLGSTTAVAASLLGCSGGATPGGGPVTLPSSTGLVVTPPNQSVYLRASFDGDPTPFVGRFVPDNLANGQIDENAAVKTRCSEHITFTEVKASGSYDEVFHSSSNVSGRLGVPPIASADGGAGATSVLRVRYELTKKIRADVADPAALDQCCQAQPDQCAGSYIGEFYEGSGQVMQAAGTRAEFEASGITPEVTGDIEFKDEIAWKRVTTFDDVYFAFRTNAATLQQASAEDGSDCGWAYEVPSSLDGTYFVGISPPAATQDVARDAAMQNARLQVVKYLSGEYLKSEVKSTTSALDGIVSDERVVTAAAEGVVEFVKDKKWCKPEVGDNPKGATYTVKVLAFLPNTEKKKAAHKTVGSIAKALESEGKLKGKVKRELDQLSGELAK